jgi:hypothetical protein
MLMGGLHMRRKVLVVPQYVAMAEALQLLLLLLPIRQAEG